MLRKSKLKRPLTKKDLRDLLEDKHGHIKPTKEKEVKRKKTPEEKILEKLFSGV